METYFGYSKASWENITKQICDPASPVSEMALTCADVLLLALIFSVGSAGVEAGWRFPDQMQAVGRKLMNAMDDANILDASIIDF